jgi:mannose-6-phosphate isomerase-like protein (cupin superfamily)
LDSGVPYGIAHAGDHAWEERPSVGSEEPRHSTDITMSAELTESRARMWRIPPHARGRRHIDGSQEEVFVVLEGTLTLLVGEPPERFDLARESVAAVKPGTPLQLRNEGDDELVVFAYGAPPIVGPSEMLDDVELPA